jgi:uncharacterized protein
MALPGRSLPAWLQVSPEGPILNLWVQPGAKKTVFSGYHGDNIKLMVQAPPVEGAANQKCLTFLAQWFGIKKSEVLLIKGEKSRSKRFLLKGLSPEKVLALIPARNPDPQT